MKRHLTVPVLFLLLISASRTADADSGNPMVVEDDRDFSTEFRALYRISSLNNFWFGYRYMNIGSDTVTDGIEYKVDMSQVGPTVGWAFTF